LIPNPVSHWSPSLEPCFARRTLATGWIYRSPKSVVPAARTKPLLLVATGGGGTVETAAILARHADAVIAEVRRVSKQPIHVVQALGPRAPEGAKLSLADRIVDPGGDLNEHFAGADAVISTAGYNSVLELAITTTPSLLMAIARTYDDQARRAESWGGLLGRNYRDEDVRGIARWLAATLEQRRRRAAIDIGPSGADAAARAILDLLN
jgi:predicted glycosyltransferase